MLACQRLRRLCTPNDSLSKCPLPVLSRKLGLWVCRVNPSAGKDPVLEGARQLAGYIGPVIANLQGKEVKPSSKAGSSSSGATQTRTTAPAVASAPVLDDDWKSPVYSIIAVCVCVFALGTVTSTSNLQLCTGSSFRWWQLVSSGFVHTSMQHLAENVFVVYTFGRLIERSHGAIALWATYLISIIGANLFAWFMLPAKAGLALSASSCGGLGLMIAGLMWPRLPRKPLEVAALAPFVLFTTMSKYISIKGSVVNDGTPVGHLLHVTGAIIGASIVAGILHIVDRIRDHREAIRMQKEKEEAARRRAEQAAREQQAMAQAVETAAKTASNLINKML